MYRLYIGNTTINGVTFIQSLHYYLNISSMSNSRPKVTCSNHSLVVEIDYKITSMVILSIPLIQEVQLSVTDKSMCTGTG